MKQFFQLVAVSFALSPLVGMCAETAAARSVPSLAAKIGYNQFIRPILSDNCSYCHGPDKNHRQAELRLDARETAVAKGAIVPGKPDESEMIRRILSKDADERMPPPSTHKRLTDKQKQLLKTWIEQGAVYEPHWAYIAPVRRPAPAVKNRAWVKNPVDAFILASLEAKKLAPTKEADKRTLLRRLSLDLTGLPPTCEEVDAFLADTSADAYEKQIDRLLASPHYGERMAVPWLDAVRFADTVGFHGDQNQNVFPYRDYVIESFNKNKPFDQFTIEQLAGDLLPHPSEEQLTATCFNRLNMMTREGGAQAKEYIAKYQADRVRTVSGAWLGSTMGCCECHDHKYDPFKTKDFYALSAYWADVKQWGIYTTYSYSPNPDLAGFTNDHPFPPEAKVESAYLRERMAKCAEKMEQIAVEAVKVLTADAKRRHAFEDWRGQTREFLSRNPTGWETLSIGRMASSAGKPMKAKKAKGKNRKSTATTAVVEASATTAVVSSAGSSTSSSWKARADGSILFTGKAGQNDRLEFPLAAGMIAAIRLEAIPTAENAGSIVRGAAQHAEVAFSTELLRAEASGAPTHATKDQATMLAFDHADADFKDDRGYRNGRAALGILRGWLTSADHNKSPQQAVWTLDKPVKTSPGDTLVITLAGNKLGCVRVSVSPIVGVKAVDPNVGAPLMQAIDSSASVEPHLACTYLMSTRADAAAFGEMRKIHREYLECTDGVTPVLITQSWAPKVTRVLPRANWQDESGEIVEPHPPAFLPQLPGLEGKRQTRLDLARWLVAPENPLTSRAVVNRFWKQFFGNGLSGVVEDLGSQGEWPSHPELLDWLAVEFRESGWDVKHIVRLMVTSAAYRQDSSLRPDLHDLDPNNRWLATQNPRRLEAEFVRDNALSIAGLINLDVGGPSCKPYQPPGYYANIQFPDRDYIADTDDREYRRGLYMHWQRTFVHPMLANFDAPSREDCVCTRVVSNTPQQALTLLNDPEFVEAAKALAVLVVAQNKNDQPDKQDGARLDCVYERALARPIKANEADSLKHFLAGQRSYFKTNPADAGKLLKIGLAEVPAGDDAIELAAWTNVCRVVLNLHETITRY